MKHFFSKYASYYRQNLRLALPVIVSQVGQISVTVVDTIMVGRLSHVGLAAIGFANSISMPAILLGLGLSMGLTPLVGKSLARKDFNRTTSLLKNSLALNMMYVAVLIALLLALPGIMDYMGQDAEILPTARSYYYWITASALPAMLFFTGRQFLEGLGNTHYAMIITIISNLVNVLLNFCFIYGLWFFPEMGAVGAGTATFIARVLQFLLFATLILNREQYSRYLKNMRNVKLCKFRLRRLLNIGIPISIQVFIEIFVFSIMAIAIGTFGAKALAAHQIANNVASMAYMVVIGFQAAATILVSQYNGARLWEQMRMTMRASLHIIIIFELFTAICIALFSRDIASLFTTEATVITIASNFLLLGALFQISDGIQGVSLGGLRGILIVKSPMYITILGYIIISLPVAWICSYPLGMDEYGTWVGFIVALTIFAVTFTRLFFKKISKLQRQ